MVKPAIFGIIGGIIVAIALISVFSLQVLSDQSEIQPVEQEDEFLLPQDEVEKEIQEKLDEIEQQKENTEVYVPDPRDWQTSGPFQVDRTKYVLGENVFIRVGGLPQNEKGQIAFLRPLNETHYSVYITIPFDGLDKEQFNWYFKPALSKQQGICNKDELIGNWTVVFRGTNYKNLSFKIVDEVVPGSESSYEESVC